jgi:putative transposase
VPIRHRMQATLPRRSYDHRIREAICETRDPDLFPELRIPDSTIRCWLHRGASDVETVEVLHDDRLKLLAQNRELQRRVAFLGAMVGVFVALIRVSKSRLDFERTPDANSKRLILRAIDRSKKAMPLTASLRLAGISASRYHSWCRIKEGCDLEDQPSCPRAMPSRLTSDEVAVIETMVTSGEQRFMSVRALALYAQRVGKVFASPTTWYRLIRRRGWRRPRTRVYPPKPKVGVRAMAPGELLHLDVTIIKLLDGTRMYLHAIIDNYSRRILSWTLESCLGSGATCRVLREAAMEIVGKVEGALLVSDAGSENVNRNVDDALEGVDLERVLAQIDVTYSNSMIEAFWRSLKHSWLYLHGLETETELRRLVAFYVEAHNDVMSHSAFAGQTPNEVFFGTGDAVAARLAAKRVQAQTERIDRNRSAGCGVCIARAG